MKILTSLLLIICFVPAFGDKTERAWQTGIVTDAQNNAIAAKHPDCGGLLKRAITKTEARTVEAFTIDTDDLTYFVTISSKGPAKVDLTVNGKVKFAVEGKDFYVTDDSGNEFKLHIEKKILKEKAMPPRL